MGLGLTLAGDGLGGRAIVVEPMIGWPGGRAVIRVLGGGPRVGVGGGVLGVARAFESPPRAAVAATDAADAARDAA